VPGEHCDRRSSTPSACWAAVDTMGMPPGGGKAGMVHGQAAHCLFGDAMPLSTQRVRASQVGTCGQLETLPTHDTGRAAAAPQASVAAVSPAGGSGCMTGDCPPTAGSSRRCRPPSGGRCTGCPSASRTTSTWRGSPPPPPARPSAAARRPARPSCSSCSPQVSRGTARHSRISGGVCEPCTRCRHPQATWSPTSATGSDPVGAFHRAFALDVIRVKDFL
jgi:hypothetical protein